MVKCDFIKGLNQGIPIFVGYFSASIAFGLIANSAGLTAVEAILFSALNFTGAAQFLAINLILAGAAAGEVIISFFLVNLRYFLMSASLNSRHDAKSHLRRNILSFGVTDEVFSVAMGRGKNFSSSYLFGLQLISWIGWVSGTAIGFLGGNFLPVSLQAAVGISLYGLFAALLVPEVKKNIKALILAGAAGGVNSFLVLCLKISAGWGMVISMLLTTTVAALLWKEDKEESNTGDKTMKEKICE